MEPSFLIGPVIQDPFERIVIRVASNMIAEPRLFDPTEKHVSEIIADLEEIVKLDPEFISKLSYYSRNELNLRSTSNFLAAWACTKPLCYDSLKKYFNFIINLPSDLLDFIEKYQTLIKNKEKPKFPSIIQSLVKQKFCDFNIYQLGKYCSEGKRKRDMNSGKNKKKISMKLVIKCCHVKRPALLVASIIGKKYPETLEAFLLSSFSAESDFDPKLAGKRMKIPTPVTWETTLSSEGNKAECWEKLIKSNKLPFMAMIRNIRNLLVTGVDKETHDRVVSKLSNPDVIQNSRLFPLRFLSAFESIDVNIEELEKLKNDPEYRPPEPKAIRGTVTSSRGGRRIMKYYGQGVDVPEQAFKRKVKIPKVLPTHDVISNYKSALEEAVKIATALNVNPIRGHTVIFCDVPGSMQCGAAFGGKGNLPTYVGAGYLFALMLRHVCETSDMYLLSSPNPPKTLKPWRKLDLEGDDIFNLLQQVTKVSEEMGQKNEYPIEWLKNAIKEKLWMDNLIFVSEMIICQICLQTSIAKDNREGILKKYRDKVNSNMRCITIDLAGNARESAGADFQDQFKNIVIGGYSDAILKFVSLTQTTQADAVRASRPIKRSKIFED
jgi:telomerase protein component 1